MSLLPTVETETAEHPRYSILWLHGLGADGHDFAPLVPELVAPAWPALRFVFPHAPMRPVTVNGGMPMRAWYDIKGMDIADKQDADGVAESVAQIRALIAAENARGIPCERIVLAGFSQGGAIALAAGLQHAERLAGIVALSTYVPLQAMLATRLAEANRDVPVFWGHGQMDPVVPLALGEASRDWLQGLGYRLQWQVYRMAHQVCAGEITDLRTWLAARWA